MSFEYIAIKVDYKLSLNFIKKIHFVTIGLKLFVIYCKRDLFYCYFFNFHNNLYIFRILETFLNGIFFHKNNCIEI